MHLTDQSLNESQRTCRSQPTKRTIYNLALQSTTIYPLEKVSCLALKPIIGVIGGVALSPKVANRVQNLALLIDNEDAFEMMFTQKVQEDKTQTKQKGGKVNDHIDNLLKHSKTFSVNEIQHEYVDSDPIFYMREPN